MGNRPLARSGAGAGCSDRPDRDAAGALAPTNAAQAKKSAAAFLGTETIDPDPAHVTYVYSPATKLARVTIDAAGAKVDRKAHLDVTTDGPLTVTLEHCRGTPKTLTAGFG